MRIEDTDQERSTPESAREILESLKWLGLDWDDGPYFQSERRQIYRAAAEKLLDEGKAFYTEDPQKGRAIAFRIEQDQIEVDDLIHGKVIFRGEHINDFIILKSNGFPTYNFACVVDDSEMQFTHVIRGDDHLTNTPKQIALYQALGKPVPKFAHLPLITAPDGSRFSKRHGAASVMEYKRLGYLSEALVNFIALLGWSPGGNIEIMSRDEMVEKFSLERVRPTPAKFDIEKLRWMNGVYIRNSPVEKLIQPARDAFAERAYDVSVRSDEWFRELLTLYHERIVTFGELANVCAYLFTDDYQYDEQAVEKLLKKEGVRDVLKTVVSEIERMEDFEIEGLESVLRTVAERHGLGFSRVAQPIRVAITGTNVSPPIFGTMKLLGKEKVVQRLKKFC